MKITKSEVKKVISEGVGLKIIILEYPTETNIILKLMDLLDIIKDVMDVLIFYVKGSDDIYFRFYENGVEIESYREFIETKIKSLSNENIDDVLYEISQNLLFLSL